MEFIWVENMDEVIAHVLLSDEVVAEQEQRDLVLPPETLPLPEIAPEATI